MAISRDAAIRNAHIAVEAIADDYPARLHAHLNEVERSIENRDSQRIKVLSNLIRGEGTTMGWPLVSEAAGGLWHLLEEEGDKVDGELLSIFAQSLRKLAQEDLKGRTKQGITLIQELGALIANKTR